MKDRIVLVTGGNSGIGYEFAKKMAKMGARVILACRSREKGRYARRQIIIRSNNRKIEVLNLDLLSEDAIHRFAEEFNKKYGQLDVLHNNAGASFFERKLTEGGVEYNFMVNYLGHFLLTNLLLPKLEKSEAGRIINTVGIFHKRGKIDFNNLQSEQQFHPMQAASNALLAKLIFTKELARRMTNTNVTVNAYHPGAVRSPLQKKLPWTYRWMAEPMSWFFKSPREGAETAIQLAIAPEYAEKTGLYFYNNQIVEPAPLAEDEDLARRLWAHSELLLGGKVMPERINFIA